MSLPVSSDDEGRPALESSPGIQEPLADVIRASKLPAKQRGENIRPTVDRLASLAYDQGLLPTDLSRLIELITTPSFLDQASLASIVRNLYPATTVSGDLIIRVIGSLGHGKLKPSFTVQAALLKWLIMIQHVVESQTPFIQAYPVLFNLLDTASLRAYACHLLALITRRRHVRPHRIQSLLLLSRQTGGDPAITGLLRVYKDYYPEIIVGDATRGKASAFKYPDPQWRERLEEIRQDHAQRRASRAEQPLDAFRVARHRWNGTKGLSIPEVHTSRATEDSVTLEEIESVDGFVNRLEKIELPNQLIAILNDPLLQKLLLLRPQAEAHIRACNWLNSYTQDMMAGDSDVRLLDILNALKGYVIATKDLPPIFLAFLREVIGTWDGVNGREVILEILTYTPVVNFGELLEHIFQPLEQAILDGTPNSQCQLLDFFTHLLRRWMVYWAAPDGRSPQISETIAQLIAHVNELCLTLVQTSPTVAAQGKILDFYYHASALSADAHILTHAEVSATPPAVLVYNLFFAASPVTISRTCSVVAKYKEGFQVGLGEANIDYTPKHIPAFNGFLMDICNCLWRQRALSDEHANANACLMAKPVVEDMASYVSSLSMGSSASLANLFSLSYSPAFSLFAISFLREMEDAEEERDGLEIRHAGPVTKNSLRDLGKEGGVNLSWDDYRRGVLDYLDQHGMGGVKHLMSITIGALRQGQAGR
ncbi:Mis6-domain-containing protein [Xylariaceae sp. FL0594]|nr:Mis6-domain-containing protein [Xylariaceae sp. FL0594]